MRNLPAWTYPNPTQGPLPSRVPGHTYIYILFDPDTDNARYVGKADDPADRLYMHLTLDHLNRRTHLGAWLRKLERSGKVPVMRVVDLVPLPPCPCPPREPGSLDLWEAAEQAWIRDLQLLDCDLTNIAKGGRGPVLTAEAQTQMGWKNGRSPMSEAEKAKRRRSMIGRKMPPGTGAKISAAKKGVKHPNQRGENCVNAKMTDEAVVELRLLHAAGASVGDLAMRYGLSSGAVSAIASGRTWSHVGGPLGQRRPRLSASVLATIREAWANGESARSIAARFNTTLGTVYYTLRRNAA